MGDPALGQSRLRSDIIHGDVLDPHLCDFFERGLEDLGFSYFFKGQIIVHSSILRP